MEWPVSFDLVDFEEAIAWFRERVPMEKEAWEALDADAQRRAFTVANVTQLEVVNDTWVALDVTLSEGGTLKDFKDLIGDDLEEAWGGDVANPDARLETIFRTNIQAAYGEGRFAQVSDPAIKKRFPYLALNVLSDNRTSEICEQLKNVVLRADNPWWNGRIPPLHFGGCRTELEILTEEEAEARGITRSPPNVKAQDGFGNKPVPGASSGDVDEAADQRLKDMPDDLAEIARQKLSRDPE